jgi:hypothetical protein
VRWAVASIVVLVAACGGNGESADLGRELQPFVAAGVPGALAYVCDGEDTATRGATPATSAAS